jgi:ribosome recycling factor
MKLDTTIYEEKMKKSIASYSTSLETIRVGRANANVLNQIKIDYWGVPTPINQVGDIKTPDARTLLITPWDKNLVKSVERAINESNLGINPQSDGTSIRLSFPSLTEERRKELQKQVSKMGEEAKVAVRNIRRDAMDEIKNMKKNSTITEDEQKISEKEVQDLTDKYIVEVDKVTEKKNKEIIEI